MPDNSALQVDRCCGSQTNRMHIHYHGPPWCPHLQARGFSPGDELWKTSPERYWSLCPAGAELHTVESLPVTSKAARACVFWPWDRWGYSGRHTVCLALPHRCLVICSNVITTSPSLSHQGCQWVIWVLHALYIKQGAVCYEMAVKCLLPYSWVAVPEAREASSLFI